MCVWVVTTFGRFGHRSCVVPNPVGGHRSLVSRGKRIPLWARSRLRIWSRKTGLAVPSCVSPLILRTRSESDWLMVLTDGLIYTVNYHRVSSYWIIVYQVTQLRTDGVHRRECASTGSIVLKVALVTETRGRVGLCLQPGPPFFTPSC